MNPEDPIRGKTLRPGREILTLTRPQLPVVCRSGSTPGLGSNVY
jgi:hypothetical protein